MLFGPEFRWVLKGHTPETLPMARLAEYMQEVARLLGEPRSVFCLRIEKSSVAAVCKAATPEVGGKVSARVDAVRIGKSTIEARNAYNKINEMLCEDNATAFLKKNSAIIIKFPGIVERNTDPLVVSDYGSVDGYLYMLSQSKDGFRARLRIDESTLNCTVKGSALQDMKDLLFETVRVSGQGRWQRNDDGIWHPISLCIDAAKLLKRSSLKQAVKDLQSIDLDWPEDPLGILSDLNLTGDRLQ